MLKEEVENSAKDKLEMAPDSCQTADEWQFLRGQLSILRWLAALEEVVQAEIESLRNDTEEENYGWYE